MPQHLDCTVIRAIHRANYMEIKGLFSTGWEEFPCVVEQFGASYD